jgi:uncharacterized protein (TIGR02145 family)
MIKKYIIWTYPILFIMLLLNSCKKEDEPVIIPEGPTNLIANTISSSEIELSWKDNSENESEFKIERKTGSEEYTLLSTTRKDVTIYKDKNLAENTTYSYKVYAVNSLNEASTKSNEASAQTNGVPLVSTNPVSSVTAFKASSGGEIKANGGSEIIARGVVWSTNANPTVALSTKTLNGTGDENFMSDITGLEWETTYYLRAYASNATGTGYGDLITFTTAQVDLTTITVSDISLISAVSGGIISEEGGTSVISRGVVWNTSPAPTVSLATKTTDGINSGSFTSMVNGLDWNTTYHIRAYATNSSGTRYGNEQTFTTEPIDITTAPLTDITLISAISGGTITGDAGSTITGSGIVWDTSPNPTVSLLTKTDEGLSPGNFSSAISNLSPDVTYYIRAYVSNSRTTTYGQELNFKTLNSIIDFDGNSYKVVKIGSQIWMAENLKTTSYNDGTPIPNVTDAGDWIGLTSGAYTYYNNDAATYKNPYGAIYNGYAVQMGSLCPDGWHIPSEDEWIQLANFVGGEAIAGGQLKEAGTDHWAPPNTGATNNFGFTAVPSGHRWTDGRFYDINEGAQLWSSTESEFAPGNIRIFGMSYLENNAIRPSYPQIYGAACRCVMD